MLYIMRHGKTDWNAKNKLQGRIDIPLNEEGRKAAQEAAKEYSNIHFDICYCSPLKRARETAELVLKGRNVPIITDDRLMEMSFGVYEGIENSFQIPDCPINELFYHPENYIISVEKGESLNELFSRTNEFITEVVEPVLAQGKDVLIIGHGVTNRSIVSQIQNLPVEKLWSIEMKNCELMKLR